MPPAAMGTSRPKDRRISNEASRWHAPTHASQGVQLLFVLLVPEQATEQHLQILSELAQMFSDRAFREQLTAASDAAAIHALFSDWQAHAPGERRAAV